MAHSETKLSPALIAELSKRNSLGSGYRALQEWLSGTHKIELSHITIRKKILAYREDNYELSKELRAEKKEQLSITIDADLALIQHEIDAMLKIAAECEAKRDKRNRMAVTDRLAKLVDLRRKFCGVKTPEEEIADKAPAQDHLMSRLDDLIERRKADKEPIVSDWIEPETVILKSN